MFVELLGWLGLRRAAAMPQVKLGFSEDIGPELGRLGTRRRNEPPLSGGGGFSYFRSSCWANALQNQGEGQAGEGQPDKADAAHKPQGSGIQ